VKILFITQLLPYPPRTGGKVKTFNILKLLAKQHQIHLVTFHDRKSGQTHARQLEKLLNIKVKSFYRPLVTAPSKKIKTVAFKSLFSTKPFRVYKYFSQTAADYLNKISQKQQFDIIYLDHNTSCQYLSFINQSKNSKVIYDEHNINSLAMLRLAKFPRKNFFMRGFMLYDALKNYYFERKIVQQVDYIYSISSPDRQKLIKRGANPKTTKVLPVPFKTKPQFKYSNSKPTILIVGLMSWAPNKMGIIWFCQSVYPLIKQALPKIKLILVGPRPEKVILTIARRDPSITVTNEVKSIKPYYKQANLLAAPIPFGSGIRIKILHALAAGMPVVSNPIGAEGINPKNKNGILVTPYHSKKFAQAIIKVIKQKSLANQLSHQGIQTINQHYSSNQALKILSLLNA